MRIDAWMGQPLASLVAVAVSEVAISGEAVALLV
jgi:hypothetical protein